MTYMQRNHMVHQVDTIPKEYITAQDNIGDLKYTIFCCKMTDLDSIDHIHLQLENYSSIYEFTTPTFGEEMETILERVVNFIKDFNIILAEVEAEEVKASGRLN